MFFKTNQLSLLTLTTAIALAFLTAACSPSGSGSHDNAPVVAEGTSNGGGGKGVMCDGKVQVLDLYEAQVQGKKLLPNAGTYDTNVEKFAASLAGYFSDPQDSTSSPVSYVDAFKKSFSDKVVYLAAGQKLPTTLDATLPILNSNCSFVQIAVWAHDEKIYIDQNLWDHLDNQNKAALALHELVYMISRSHGEKTSDESRFVISEIFTNLNPIPRLGPFESVTDYLWCGAGGGDDNGSVYEVFFYDELRNGVTGVGIYFRAIADEYTLSRTEAFVPNMSTQKMETSDAFGFSTTVTNEARKLQWKYELAKNSQGQISMKAWQKDPPSAVSGFCQHEKTVSK